MREEISWVRMFAGLAVAFFAVNALAVIAWVFAAGIESVSGSQALAMIGGLAAVGGLMWVVFRPR